MLPSNQWKTVCFIYLFIISLFISSNINEGIKVAFIFKRKDSTHNFRDFRSDVFYTHKKHKKHKT